MGIYLMTRRDRNVDTGTMDYFKRATKKIK